MATLTAITRLLALIAVLTGEVFCKSGQILSLSDYDADSTSYEQQAQEI